MSNAWDSVLGFKRPAGRTAIFLIVLIHILIWCLFFLLPLLFYPVAFDSRFWFRELVSKLFPVGLFYLNYYVLLPRFFERKKFFAYFSLVCLAILMIVSQEIVIRYKLFQPVATEIPFERNRVNSFIYRSDNLLRSSGLPRFHGSTVFGIPRRSFFISVDRMASLCILLLLSGALIRLGFSFIKNQNEKKLLENTNLNAEINFLKSQVNPHFLFNTLNGIYSLAQNHSDLTGTAILKLSELMRYVLYESGTEKVELAKDIQYLNNYVDLQRLRLSSKVIVQYEVKGNLYGHYIAPLLLISFIENAFKHGISYTNSSVVKIQIEVFEETLTLVVENPIVESDSFAGGVGLKNVKRRLEVLYPGKFSLNITNTDRLYLVHLKLNLK